MIAWIVLAVWTVLIGWAGWQTYRDYVRSPARQVWLDEDDERRTPNWRRI